MACRPVSEAFTSIRSASRPAMASSKTSRRSWYSARMRRMCELRWPAAMKSVSTAWMKLGGNPWWFRSWP